MIEYLALVPIILPILGALATYGLGKISVKMQDVFLVVFTALLFVINAAYLVGLQSTALRVCVYGCMVLDSTGAFIGTLVAFLGAMVVFYSFVYKDRAHYDNTFFIMYFLLMGTMIGLASTYNVIVMLIFLEAATVISAVLILFGRTKKAIRATYIYLAISIVEVILVVIGAFILYNDAGILDLSLLQPGAVSENDMFLLAMLFLFGFGTKAGLLPLGIVWLPPAHSEAPPPISATMSGILVMASAIAMIKAVYPFYLISGVGTLILVIAAIGVLNMLIGVVGALLSRDLKRVLAYSTVSSVGYIVLGLALATPVAISGSLFYIASHMLYKGCLFMIAGALILRVHTRQIHKMGGLFRQMPLTGSAFLVAALAISGAIPFLNGFVGKELIYQGAANAGYPVYFTAFGIEFTAFAIVGWITSLLTLIVFLRAFWLIFMGKPREEFKDARDPPVYMLLPILIMAGLCVVIGVYPDLISGALQYTAQTLAGLTHI